MAFRWIVLITLWTALSGPVLSRPALPARSMAGPNPSSRNERGTRAPSTRRAVEARGSLSTSGTLRNR
jgi:hypothetical protein